METSKLIYDVIDEINLDLEDELKLAKNPETVIFGAGSSLDSIGLITFITMIEEKIEEQTGEFISIADEKAMSMVSSPFRTVNTLQQYIDKLLETNQ